MSKVDETDSLHGVCLVGEGRALIKVRENTEEFMCEVLLEEYAHVAREECPLHTEDDHDPMFWCILAAVTKKWRGE